MNLSFRLSWYIYTPVVLWCISHTHVFVTISQTIKLSLFDWILRRGTAWIMQQSSIFVWCVPALKSMFCASLHRLKLLSIVALSGPWGVDETIHLFTKRELFKFHSVGKIHLYSHLGTSQLCCRRWGIIASIMISLYGHTVCTVKPVCNDHLYNKMYYLWFIH